MERNIEIDIMRELAIKRAAYAKPSLKVKLMLFLSHVLNNIFYSKRIQSILCFFRSEEKVLKKYDSITGSYINQYKEAYENNRKIIAVFDNRINWVMEKDVLDAKNAYIAENIIKPLHVENKSFIDIGAGELTTTCSILQRLPTLSRIAALELSWSRLAAGRFFAKEKNVKIDNLIVGTVHDLAIADNSFDLVFTSHCLEQVPYNMKHSLSELYRISREFLILLEPSWELGDIYQKRYMAYNHYNKDLGKTIRNLGYTLIRHEFIPYAVNPDNRTAIFLIKKQLDRPVDSKSEFLVCPSCKKNVIFYENYHFCRQCGCLFPIVKGISCMKKENCILASKFESF